MEQQRRNAQRQVEQEARRRAQAINDCNRKVNEHNRDLVRQINDYNRRAAEHNRRLASESLRGHDGRRYFIPNAKVMTDVIEVETDGAKLRQSFSLLLDPGTDLAAVRAILQGAIHRAKGVCADPPTEVLLVDVVKGEVEVQCRFWTGSRRREATGARDHAISAAVAAVAEHDIALSVDELRVDLVARDNEDGRRGSVHTYGQGQR